MAKIYLFRHGQTTDNLEKIFSGKRECDLTPAGIAEATKIGEELKDVKVTRAYYSGQLRSKHTLDLVLNGWHKDVPIIKDERLRERDYGDLTGKNKDEIAKEFPDKYPLWHRSYDVPPPHGESVKDVEARVMPFIHDLLQSLKPNDVIFISAHGNSLRPFRKYFEHMTNEAMASFEHTPGKIYEYDVPVK